MRFLPTQLAGATLIEVDPHEDERGHFARIWCEEEFARHGLNTRLAQVNVSFNRRRGTLRGMHFQTAPYQEAKLVRCNRGSIYDVIVDIREDSDTYGQWQAFELSEDNGLMLYIPEGFAHGFITLSDNSEVYYQMSKSYRPDSARGFRWNDSTICAAWPCEPRVIADRDAALPTFEEAAKSLGSVKLPC